MNSTTTEEKFFSAVDIIKSLPKTGSISPSNGTKLKFYSFFKQATEGPCEIPKPGFWDVVNRAKWEAWNKLGNMSKEDAMQNYVQEFVKVIQEYSLEDLDDPSVVNEYAQIMGPFIDLAPKELQESLKMSNGTSKKPPLNNNSEDMHSRAPVNGYNLNGNSNNDSDSDEFSDTLERVNEDEPPIGNGPPLPALVAKGSTTAVSVRGGGDHNQKEGGSSNGGPSAGRNNLFPRQPRSADFPTGGSVGGGSSHLLHGAGGGRRRGDESLESGPEVQEQLALAVIRLQHVLEQVVVRLDSLEALIKRKNSAPLITAKMSSKNPSRWSFFGMSPKLAIVILAWPFIAQWLMYIIRKRQRSSA